LEELAAWYAGAHGRFPPPPVERALIAVFAADHGVSSEGISAYPSSVTAAMVANVMSGGAAIACMARRLGIDIALADVGVASDLSAIPRAPLTPLLRAPVRAGTANFTREAAMSIAEARTAMAVGAELAEQAHQSGKHLLGLGEIGIGNTTAAAALICAITGAPASQIAGNGTGLDDAGRRRKIAVIERALERHGSDRDPLHLLASLGGLEIAALVGFAMAAAQRRLPVVLDGFVTLAAALVARALDHRIGDYLFASHRSAEKGASLALEWLGKRPLFEFELRLGEGTGAALAMDLVRTAVHVQLSMATFATAGIVGRAGTDLHSSSASPAWRGNRDHEL
jgi:nicotinate-nucleotide--dimethylbenzimidazole phosphoribosyltransferase